MDTDETTALYLEAMDQMSRLTEMANGLRAQLVNGGGWSEGSAEAMVAMILQHFMLRRSPDRS
jgi:hypothetical protein